MVCVQGDATSDDAEPEVTVADTVDVGPEATPESFLTGIWRSPGTSQYLFLHLEHSDAQVTGMVGFAADDFHIDFDNGVFADDQLIFSYPVMSRGLPTTATFDLTYYEDSDQLIGTRVIDSNVPDKEIGLTFSRYDP